MQQPSFLIVGKENDKMKNNRFLPGMLAVMIGCFILLSYSFMAENTHHECSGEQCSVCSILRISEQTVVRALPAAIASVLVPILRAFTQYCTKNSEAFCAKNTLIALKVELLN